jgi:hypothetical protein
MQRCLADIKPFLRQNQVSKQAPFDSEGKLAEQMKSEGTLTGAVDCL